LKTKADLFCGLDSQLFFEFKQNFEFCLDDFDFFIGLHQPSDAQHFDKCFVSISRLGRRVGGFGADKWILDSAAFSQVAFYGRFLMNELVYARHIARWSVVGALLAAVSQDFMCEEEVLKKTGRTVIEHQTMSIQRYKKIFAYLKALKCSTYLMPVLQGYEPQEYVDHLKQWGSLILEGDWVGVGSVCKRNANWKSVYEVLDRIKQVRPDLRLHGFGLKVNCLAEPKIVELLASSDSQAWSRAARWEGRNQNSWLEAKKYCDDVNASVGRKVAG